MATLNFNSGKNFIIPTENDMTYRGLGGDDVYIISKAIESNTKIQIIDTEGSNTIQLVDGLTIANSLFTKNATRLTLSNGSEITIDMSNSKYIDSDIEEIIHEFKDQAKERKISVSLIK